MKISWQARDTLTVLNNDLKILDETNKSQNELCNIILALLSNDTKQQEEAIINLNKICLEEKHPNYANALVILGICHEYGVFPSANTKTAYECYRTANTKGSVIGLRYEARCYHTATGVKRNLRRAIIWPLQPLRKDVQKLK